MKKLIEVAAVSIVVLAIGIPSLMAGWTPAGIPICTAPNQQVAVAAAGDGFGGSVVVWLDNRNFAFYQIYAQRISPNGVPYWNENGVLVCGTNTVHGAPVIVSDGVGGAIIAWHDTRALKRGIYVQRIGAFGNALWPANGVRIEYVWDTSTQLSITTDRRGGAFLAWSQGGTIEHSRITADGEPQPIGWFASGDFNSTYSRPQIVADTAGAFVMWQDTSLGIRRHFVDHIDADGSYYSGNRRLLCDIFEDQPAALLCADGAGCAIVVWGDKRNGIDLDLFAQRLPAFGNWLWASSGVPVCTLTGEQQLKGVIPDGVGGVTITFNNVLTGDVASGAQGGDPGVILDFLDYDVCAQRLNGAGAALWGANGVTLCGSPGNQIDPVIVPASDEGAIVLWDDDRAGSYYGVYGQRVDGTGVLQWGAYGIPVSMAAQTVLATLNPVAVSNNAGGASVFWVDYRNNGYGDVYGQGLDPSGGEPVVATLLQTFAASYSGAAVAVTWTLSAMDDGAEFVVLRVGGSSDEWREISAAVRGSGLSFAFDDRDAEPGTTYRYRIDVRSGGKESTLFETEPIAIPAASLSLSQNRPNPFNPSTSIRFYLPERGDVRLDVYTVTGARIATLAEGVMDKGAHAVEWNGRDASGRAVASGVYVYSLRAGKETITKKMVLMR